MRTRRNVSIPLALVALTLPWLLSGSAIAQDRSGSVEFSPFAGGYFGGKFRAGSNAIFSRDVDVADDAAFGGRLGFNITNRFAFEVMYSRVNSHFKGTGTGLFGSTPNLGKLSIDDLEGNLVFNFGHQRVIPYFTIGAGAARFTPDVPGYSSDNDTRFTSNLGLGMKMFFNPHLGIRIDGRAHASYINNTHQCTDHGSGFCISNDFRNDDSRRWYTSGELTAGLTLAF